MSIPEFIYTVLLKPRPLRLAANGLIRNVTPSRLKRHGAVLMLNPRDPVISGSLSFGVYERLETAFFLKVCRRGMVFLDIGANIGYYSALAARRVGPEGRIVALEPDLESFHYLKETVAANGARNVVCVPKGAAAVSGSMRLHVSPDNRGDNRLYANELAVDSYEVEVVAVDELLDELEIPAVDLIKMDVQGFEGHVLNGMMETIRRSRRLVLLSEFWPHGLRSAQTDPAEFLYQLQAAGLRIYELHPGGRLVSMRTPTSLVNRYRGRRYTNIVGVRGDALPASVKIDA
jgi:FkbM family methyltransferase